jgi:hypothetical protein
MEYISLIIAILALLASAYSVYETRKYNRISQDPVIVANEKESEISYVYEITNKGNGPAYFTSVDSFFNLKKLEGSTLREKVLAHITEKGIRFKSTFTTLGQETVLAPGETVEIANITLHPDDAGKIQQIEDSVFGVRIKYKSSHGVEKVWVSDERLRNI